MRKTRCAVRKYPPKKQCLALLEHKNMPRTEKGVGLFNKASGQIRMQDAYGLVRVRGEKGPF